MRRSFSRLYAPVAMRNVVPSVPVMTPTTMPAGTIAPTPDATALSVFVCSFSRTRMSPSAVVQLTGCSICCSTFFWCMAPMDSTPTTSPHRIAVVLGPFRIAILLQARSGTGYARRQVPISGATGVPRRVTGARSRLPHLPPGDARNSGGQRQHSLTAASRSSRPLVVFAIVADTQLRRCLDAVLEIGEQSLLGQIEPVRALPVFLDHVVEPLDDRALAHHDGKLAPVVQAARREIRRTDDRRDAVREQHLAVKLVALEAMHLDPDVVEDSQSADGLDELADLERLWRTRHHADLHAAHGRADEPLDDEGILVALVLQEQRVPGVVDELGDPVARSRAPDETASLARRKALAVPVGLEALDDLAHLARAGGDDGVVARFGEVLERPVERLHERGLVVDDHRLLVGQGERWIAVPDLDTIPDERAACVAILLLAVPAGRVEDRLHLHPAPPRPDHRLEEHGVGESEHLHPKRSRCLFDRLEDRDRRIVRKHEQPSGGHTSSLSSGSWDSSWP